MNKSEYLNLQSIVEDIENSDDKIEQLERLYREVLGMIKNYELKTLNKK